MFPNKGCHYISGSTVSSSCNWTISRKTWCNYVEPSFLYTVGKSSQDYLNNSQSSSSPTSSHPKSQNISLHTTDILPEMSSSPFIVIYIHHIHMFPKKKSQLFVWTTAQKNPIIIPNPPKNKKQPPKSTKPPNPPCTCGLVPLAFCRAPGSGNFGTMSLASFGAAHVSARFSRRPSPGPEPEPSAALRKGSTSRFRVEKSSADQRRDSCGSRGKKTRRIRTAWIA